MRCQSQYLCLLLISLQTLWAAFNQVPVSTWRWYNRKNIFSSSKNIWCSGGLGAEPDVRGDGARDGRGAHPLVPRRGAAQHRRQGRSQHPQWQGQHLQGDDSLIYNIDEEEKHKFGLFCFSFYSGYQTASCFNGEKVWSKTAWNAVYVQSNFECVLGIIDIIIKLRNSKHRTSVSCALIKLTFAVW